MLRTKGINARLDSAGYFPQSMAWAGIYQPSAARAKASKPAVLDPVQCLAMKNAENGISARMICPSTSMVSWISARAA